MAVPCPACGREYDVALFAFGRTIHCTCGERVGIEPRVRSTHEQVGPGAAGEARFAADAMLGRLARWLRVLGFDTSYEEDVPDERLVRGALEEGRVILTRDRALPVEWRVRDIRVLRSEAPLDQLREVVRAFGLAERVRLFSRCTRCNCPVVPARPEEVGDRIPARVLERERELSRCPQCGRVYWSGSHTRRMRETVARALAGPAGE